ncbi:DNA damage-regulated autophagy modulator protein 1-like [Hyla sarda]|uniref:DNA damage-regulated autophagy modulator protein 1-like n=1 Tax=Hyla sarda TaxID=327740 RepID=UPI0024C2A649|nr:DNA damage-regulated autophagy modulator protein 1-like [Hyla sarda]
MELKGLGFVPLLLAFWCAAWLATSYIVTVVLGHAASPLMHISDVGNFFPENILLRIGFIGTSIGTLVLTFLIYKYMVMHTEEFRGHQVLIQRILLAIVWASCFGTAVMHVLSPEEYPRIHFVSMVISITCEHYAPVTSQAPQTAAALDVSLESSDSQYFLQLVVSLYSFSPLVFQ